MATRIIIDNRIKTYFQNDDFKKIIEKCYESNIGKNKDKKLNLKFTETYIETLYMHLNLYMNINKNQDINNKNLKEVFENICVSVLIYSFFKGEYNNGIPHNYKLDIYKAIKNLLNQLNKDKFKDLIEVFNNIKIDKQILGDIKHIDEEIDFNNIDSLISHINNKTHIKKGGTGQGDESLPIPQSLPPPPPPRKEKTVTKATEGQGAVGEGAVGEGAVQGQGAVGEGATEQQTEEVKKEEKAKEDDDKTLLNVFKMKIMYEIFLFKQDEIDSLIEVIIKETF